MKSAVLKFLRDEQGATAVEYGMIAGLIAAAIAATIKALGTDLTNVFNTICGAIKGGTATTC